MKLKTYGTLAAKEHETVSLTEVFIGPRAAMPVIFRIAKL